MLTSKGKALKLETVKEVKRNESSKRLNIQSLRVEWKDLETMNRAGGSRHDAQVNSESLEAFVVGLPHEFD